MKIIESKMPKAETLRKYYPNSKLSNEQLVTVAEFVRDFLKKEHVSPGNDAVASIIAWEERPPSITPLKST